MNEWLNSGDWLVVISTIMMLLATVFFVDLNYNIILFPSSVDPDPVVFLTKQAGNMEQLSTILS